MSQLRQNIITGEWVVLATERAKRPIEYVVRVHKKLIPKSKCVFCAGDTYKSRIRGTETKFAYVAPNKFPAFSGSNLVHEEKSGIFHKMTGSGVHELIIARDHSLKVGNASAEFWADFLTVSQKRIKESYKNKAVKFSMLIYNHGSEAGASIQHPHAQLFASPLIPNFVKQEIQGAKEYYQKHKKCVFCEMVNSEIANSVRLVYQNEHFAGFCFYASRFPFETWIVPKEHQSNFARITPSKMNFFADCVSHVMKKIHKSLNNPPWNFYVHTKPPVNSISEKAYHWHLEIAPRLSKFGGFELGGDMVINVVAPEASAEFLRKA